MRCEELPTALGSIQPVQARLLLLALVFAKSLCQHTAPVCLGFFLFVLFFVIRKNKFIPIACQISITEKLAAQLLIAKHGAGGHFAAGLFTGCAFEAQVDFPRKKAPSWPMGNQQVRSFCCASLLILNFVHKECSAHS